LHLGQLAEVYTSIDFSGPEFEKSAPGIRNNKEIKNKRFIFFFPLFLLYLYADCVFCKYIIYRIREATRFINLVVEFASNTAPG
jgi:hypothetical protein